MAAATRLSSDRRLVGCEHGIVAVVFPHECATTAADGQPLGLVGRDVFDRNGHLIKVEYRAAEPNAA